MNRNVIAYVSSRNNYDMLRGEVLKNIDRSQVELVNVDDGSDNDEAMKGIGICCENEMLFLYNKQRGVQWSTQTLIDYISEHRPECKWVICFQHDNYPISPDFFDRIGRLIDSGKLDEFGMMGFNVLDDGRYTLDSLQEFENGGKPLGMLGLCHLTEKDPKRRWLCPSQKGDLLREKRAAFEKPFIMEIPMWAAAGINVAAWKKCVKPTTDYQFHLWFPDVAIQFNSQSMPCIILPDLYCVNRQSLKRKYDIPVNSAQAAKRGDLRHFGEYGPHLEHFEKRWGWDYENSRSTFKAVRRKYKGTLLYDYYRHRIDDGPLRSYDFGRY